MNPKKVTNLFIPISSKRFWMKKLDSLEPCAIERESDDEEDVQEFVPTVGLADAAKLNNSYKELISTLGIANFHNDEALIMIKSNIDNKSRKQALEVEVLKKLEEESGVDADMCSDDDEEDDQVNPLQLESLFLWRSTKLPLNSIWHKVGVDVEFVKQTIKTYKRLMKKQLRYNVVNTNKRRSIISDDKILAVKEIWLRNRNKPLRLADIRDGVWRNDDDSQKPCYSTLSNVLRRKLRMSYRILRPRHHKTTTQDHVRLNWEWVMIQNILSNKLYELIFIDEFYISFRN